MKSTLLSLAWVAVCAGIAGLLFAIDVELNFFSWVPVWEPEVIASLAGIGVLCWAAYRLAAVPSRLPVTVTAFVFCGLLIALGALAVLPERPINQGTWFERNKASAGWYRVGRLAITCVPFFILTTVTVRRKRQPRW